MSLFERPHRLMSATGVVMGLKPEALREVDDYAVWVDKVRAELASVYGEPAAQSEVSDITYATCDHPTHFSSRITQDLFDRLRDHKVLLAKTESLSKQLAEQTQLRDLMEASVNQDTEGGKALRQQQRELRTLKASVAQLARQEAEQRYQLTCLSQQLVNVFKAEVVHVSFRS